MSYSHGAVTVAAAFVEAFEEWVEVVQHWNGPDAKDVVHCRSTQPSSFTL